MAPEPTRETPFYFSEQSDTKQTVVQREYETPTTKKAACSSVKGKSSSSKIVARQLGRISS